MDWQVSGTCNTENHSHYLQWIIRLICHFFHRWWHPELTQSFLWNPFLLTHRYLLFEIELPWVRPTSLNDKSESKFKFKYTLMKEACWSLIIKLCKQNKYKINRMYLTFLARFCSRGSCDIYKLNFIRKFHFTLESSGIPKYCQGHPRILWHPSWKLLY